VNSVVFSTCFRREPEWASPTIVTAVALPSGDNVLQEAEGPPPGGFFLLSLSLFVSWSFHEFLLSLLISSTRSSISSLFGQKYFFSLGPLFFYFFSPPLRISLCTRTVEWFRLPKAAPLTIPLPPKAFIF